MRLVKKAALVLLSFLLLACSTPEIGHVLRFGHFAPLGRHADVIVRKADYGIPGISRVYEPRLSNFGIAPETVIACEVREDWDSMSYVTEVPNSIEKWNSDLKKWADIFKDIDKFSSFIHIKTKKLWPLQSVYGGEVAMAGYDSFAVGDKARFVMFSGDHKAIPTTPILIDEHPTVAGIPFRVR